ncbi:MAG: NAD(P)-dependent oxidoreductase [Proteobacteria bacterium]|nr:NAD(P)-dependent oxidoreductase [Pseudomonadota bacterium]
MQKNTKLGWVGLGIMGGSMCQHLMSAGYPVSVFTRSKDKADAVLRNGAMWCDTPAEVAEQSDVVFTMVGKEQEVRDVYFSSNGLFAEKATAGISGKIFIDMGTTAPALTMEMADYAQRHGAQFIDAPVSGGDIGARNASLSIMAGGEDSVINNVKALFDHLGSVKIMGESGSGQHAKMCNQIVVAGTMIGVCEALLYAKSAGLNCEKLVDAIRPGAAGCWTLDNLAPRILRDDFASGFMVEHFVKDLSIALNEIKMMGVQLPGLELATNLYEKLDTMGHGKSGTQALLLALEDVTKN